MAGDPQAATECRIAARHLVLHPLTCKEHDPETFRLIRRHESVLGHWFTERLGYRLQVTADAARLSKTTFAPGRRTLRTASGRPLHQLELVTLVLVLASTIAGPPVISLRDLVDLVRSSAADAEVPLPADGTGRRALVSALRWMIDQGLASELHAHVDDYAENEDADAVVQLEPDRIALLPLPAMAGFRDASELCSSPARQDSLRQWLRSRLVEDPVLYRDDLREEEWGELRRRLGEEERYLDEMFGLVLEVRAEGVAAVDPAGTLSGRPFPAGGTIGHAALLLVDVLRDGAMGSRNADDPNRVDTNGVGRNWGGALPHERWWTFPEVVENLRPLCDAHAARWSGELVQNPERLGRLVVVLLEDVRLAERRVDPTGGEQVRLLPAAGRFTIGEPTVEPDTGRQDALW